MSSRIDAGEARRLLRWHRDHARVYPWRDSQDPYRLVVTELMLIRTRADQVAARWLSFFEKFPTLTSLAEAAESEVRESLRPLGLDWRASKVMALAKAATRTERWADHVADLPGGGPYVAASVALAVDGRGPLPVDVTIARVIARYWALDGHGEARRDPRVLAAATALGSRSRRFFHAWLDLAALVCLPVRPKCEQCPLEECRYRSKVGCCPPLEQLLRSEWRRRLRTLREAFLAEWPLERDMSGSLQTLSWYCSVNWALPCRVEWISDGAVSAFRLTLGSGRFSFTQAQPDAAAKAFLGEVTAKGILSMVEGGSTVVWLAAETTAGYPRATGSLINQTLRMALDVHFAEELQRRRRLLAESFERIGWRELQLQEPEGPADTRNDLVYRRQPIQPTSEGGGQISSDLVADMQRDGRTLTVVPDAIDAQLQRARLIYVRGWHQWELYTEAEEKTLMVLEASLRELYVRSLGDGACLVSGIDATGQARSLNVSPDWNTLFRMNGELRKLLVQGRPFPRSKPDLVAFAVATYMLSVWEGEKASILFTMRDMSVHRTGEPMIAWIGWALSGIALAVELINRMWARQAAGLPAEVTRLGTT